MTRYIFLIMFAVLTYQTSGCKHVNNGTPPTCSDTEVRDSNGNCISGLDTDTGGG